MATSAGTPHASAASYNNQWGVPLSLSRMPADTRFGVFELGMNHAGEIASLVQIVQPLEDKGLLAPGMTAVAFARIWYALFFGQIALEGEHALSINSEGWLTALRVLADAVVAKN